MIVFGYLLRSLLTFNVLQRLAGYQGLLGVENTQRLTARTIIRTG